MKNLGSLASMLLVVALIAGAGYAGIKLTHRVSGL